MENSTLNAKQAAAIAVITTAAATAAATFFLKDGSLFFLAAITFITCIPLMIFSLYLWITGNGSRWLNMGVDWSKVKPEDGRKYASHMGKYMTAAMVLLMYAMASIMMDIVLFAVLMVICVSLSFVPLIPIFGKSRGSNLKSPPSWPASKAAFAVILIVAVAVAPTYAVFNAEGNSSAITVEFGEETFSIRAPMVNETFRYDEISGLVYDPDFIKGMRIGGYGTPTIHSGNFKNDVFGKYTLASYTKVKPCVAFYKGENAYAFNQADDEQTHAAYERILAKITP